MLFQNRSGFSDGSIRIVTYLDNHTSASWSFFFFTWLNLMLLLFFSSFFCEKDPGIIHHSCLHLTSTFFFFFCLFFFRIYQTLVFLMDLLCFWSTREARLSRIKIPFDHTSHLWFPNANSTPEIYSRLFYLLHLWMRGKKKK